MLNFKISLIGAVLVLASVEVFAQAAAAPAATPRIDQREANQDKRIDQGVASGELTKPEAKRLEKQQDAVERAEDKAKADGVVTKHERKRLHKMENHSSRSIYRQKHDAQQRP